MTLPDASDDPSWKNLLPELLLALLGCSGGAFVYESVDIDAEVSATLLPAVSGGESWRASMKNTRLVLSDLVDWVSEAEREQINRLARLGWYYAWLVGYATDLTAVVPKTSGGLRSRRSPYHVAVAQGCLEILDVYRQAVLNIESRVVEAGAGVGSALWSLLPLEEALSEFVELFQFLYDRIERIERGEHIERSELIEGDGHDDEPCSARSTRSPPAIEVFEEGARSGIPVVEGCSLRIAWHCYQVLFKQMHGWMVHGRLVDPTGEFFIRVEDGGCSGNTGRDGGRSQCMDADVLKERLPGAISLAFAKDVLYVGQCARVLKSLEMSGGKGGKGGGSCDVSEMAVESSDIAFEEGLRKIWTSPPERLDWIALRNLVNAQKLVLSDRVWREMHHTDRNLAEHVDQFVDVMLQNRGSLYAELVEAVAGVSSEDPDPERAAALAAHLYREASCCDGADIEGVDVVFAGQNPSYMGDRGDGTSRSVVTMTWYDTRRTTIMTTAERSLVRGIVPIWHPNYDQGVWVPPYDAWDGLCLRYDMKWPMDLVFPVKAMRLYGALWQLMFRLSRALYDMKRIRMLMTRGMGVRSSASATTTATAATRQTMALHHRLYHFLATYAIYLQEEIVARSKGKIYGILTSSMSLIEAEAKHMEFITEVAQASCIDVKQVMGVLENMFVCVKSLERVVSGCGTDHNGRDGYGHDGHSLEGINELFLSKYNVWYQLLQSSQLQSGTRGESIRRLLLRMNFSGFMDSNAAKQVDRNVLHLVHD